jgi:hypothetical protein
MNLTCIPANEVAFGFRWTRRTSLLELTTTRLAEDLGANESLPLEALVTILCENEIERSKDLVADIMVAIPAQPGSGIRYSLYSCTNTVHSQSIYNASDPLRLEKTRIQAHAIQFTVTRSFNGRKILPRRHPGHPNPTSDWDHWVVGVEHTTSNPRVEDRWDQSPHRSDLMAAAVRLKDREPRLSISGVPHRDPIARHIVHR